LNTAALERDAFAPQQPAGMGSGLLLALLAHALLILALVWGVSWKASEPEGVVAELWSALPQTAAPRPTPPEPKPPVVVEAKPAPPVVPKVEPAPPPRVDAQIAIERAREQARRDEAERAEAQRKAEAAKRDQAEKKKLADAERQRLADEQAEKKKLAEQQKKDEARQAAIREANLRRMMSQAGTSEDRAAGREARAPPRDRQRRAYVGALGELCRPDQGADQAEHRADRPAGREPLGDGRGEGRSRRHDRRQEARHEQRLADVGRDRAAGDRQDRGAAEGRRRPRAADDHDRVPAARVAWARRLPRSAVDATSWRIAWQASAGRSTWPKRATRSI
jgi:colicin import membrane protein